MNILYFHANLLRDNYRCRQVHIRLLHYLQISDIDAIFITGADKNNTYDLAQLKQQWDSPTLPFIDRPGSYRIADLSTILDNQSMTVDGKRFIPQDGSVIYIETLPVIKGRYIALDLFAGEDFADYHDEMDAQTLLELSEMIKGVPNLTKNHLN
jgi:hypothetical protein